jgi:dihydrofolate reductase
MGKIQLYIASSLDGYIARDSGEVDWLFSDRDYGYTEFLAQIDTVLMGNKTYQQLLGFGEYPYSGKTAFVFSRTLAGQKDERVEFIGGKLQDFVQGLQKTSTGNIWLVGGSEIIYDFLKHGLIDEFILSIHPVILGSGIPLIVRDRTLFTKLELQDVKTYNTGLVQLSYRKI